MLTVKQRILASLPHASLSKLRSALQPGRIVEEVAYEEILQPRCIQVGGFVVIDPHGWHLDSVASAAKRTIDGGARLVLYCSLTSELSKYITAARSEAIPEVVLTNTEDAPAILRVVLSRDALSVPALVMAGLCVQFGRLPHPIGSRLLSYLAWAPIPGAVHAFCDEVRLSRQIVLGRLHERGLRDTAVLLEVMRIARACHELLDGISVTTAARRAFFNSERTMRDAFKRQLGVTPSEVMRDGTNESVAQRLIAAATRVSK